MKKIYALLLLFVLSVSLIAQSYNNPESAVYDPVNDQYLISNAGNGTIVAVDVSSHTLSNFITTGLNSPKGMCVTNNTLFVTDVTKVHIIDLSSGSISQSVTITDAQQLNDITTNGDTLFITDMQASKIFYMTTSGSNGLLSDSWSLDSPNGILFDNNNDLVVVSFVSNSPLQTIDRDDGIVNFEMGTAISDMDGLTQAANGTYYVSSWDVDAVLEFSSVMSPPSSSDRAVNTAIDPADIYYDDQYDVLIVPLFSNNDVMFVDASNLSVPEHNKDGIKAFPIPASKTIYFNIPDEHIAPENKAFIYNMEGKQLKEVALNKSKIGISGLPAGAYIVKFKLENETRTERIVIKD
ncbi:MAG: T9SS type A sorting domain-containing protein [Bacteroidales bacterium]|nr:T9SS type A sorting domain-containing protein [Bacteroidales bacterium]